MSAISFEDRAVIVTGAGGALGRAYALEIARRGGAVAVNDLGAAVEGGGADRGPADAVVAEITAEGGRAIASYEDLADPDGARRVADAALEAFGRIDALVNNAGNLRCGWFEDTAPEDLDSLLRNHVTTTFNMTQAVWPHMKARGYGRIVFTSSASGVLGNPAQSAYGAAKAAVTGLMHVLSIEGEPHGILCNAMMPYAASRMAPLLPPEVAGLCAPYVADFAHTMTPEFNAGAVVYMASDACTTTHASYSVLGGRVARVFIGLAPGWQGPRDRPATADEIAEHIDQIREVGRGFFVPRNMVDECRALVGELPPEG